MREETKREEIMLGDMFNGQMCFWLNIIAVIVGTIALMISPSIFSIFMIPINGFFAYISMEERGY